MHQGGGSPELPPPPYLIVALETESNMESNILGSNDLSKRLPVGSTPHIFCHTNSFRKVPLFRKKTHTGPLARSILHQRCMFFTANEVVLLEEIPATRDWINKG